MNLYIKQKVFSFGDKFSVYDVNGNPIYTVEGEIFSFGKKLHIYDLNHNEVGKIEQELFRLMPTFMIRIPGKPDMALQKKFTLFYQRYLLDGLGWEIEGNFFDHEYQITCGGSTVATMQKEWLSWGDTYALSVHDAQNSLTALAAVLIIDAVNDSRN